MKRKGKTSGGSIGPFCLSGHAWVPHDWLNDFRRADILKDSGAGKLGLVRTGHGKPSFPKPLESREAIEKWSSERHDAECERFVESDRDSTANLFVRSRVSKDATLSMTIKAGQLVEMISELAKEGNPRAVEWLVHHAQESCATLNQIAEITPELLLPVSRRSWKWPVLKSLHPYLSDDHERILKTLQLGADTPLEIHPSARWIADDAGSIAFQLLFYLWRAQKPRRKDFKPGPIGKLADKLDEFTTDTAGEWWKLALACLLLAYPKPECVPELSALVTAASHIKSPGRIRFRILKVLKERFHALARP